MSEVRRRCVFYVSGFDPKGASHYHSLYLQQSALQARVGGLDIKVGPRQRQPDGNSAWAVSCEDGGVSVQTSYEFIRWDDVVRAHWQRREWFLWGEILATSLFNLRRGVLWKMLKVAWPPGLALAMPFALLIWAFLGIPIVSAGAAAIAQGAGASTLASLGVCAAIAIVLVWMARKLEARFSMYWLMRSYSFTRHQACGRLPDLEARLDAMAHRIARRVAEGTDDEVLVVGHSSGAIMAVAALSRALAQLEAGPAGRAAPVLSLLTLGQCIPMLGIVPEAAQFRRELSRLATSDRLAGWTDFSAPPDGCCFALTDPFDACGIDVERRLADRPKLLSPRFARMFDATQYRALRRDKFRMHFQYLMAPQLGGGEYDYFRITAGRLTLPARFHAVPGVVDYSELRPFFAR